MQVSTKPSTVAKEPAKTVSAPITTSSNTQTSESKVEQSTAVVQPVAQPISTQAQPLAPSTETVQEKAPAQGKFHKYKVLIRENIYIILAALSTPILLFALLRRRRPKGQEQVQTQGLFEEENTNNEDSTDWRKA